MPQPARHARDTRAAATHARPAKAPDAARAGACLGVAVAVGGPLALAPAASAAPAPTATTAAAAATAPTAAAAAVKPATYTVRRGDTLGGIAARSGTTVARLVAANGLSDPNRLRVGQVLVLGTGTTPSTTIPSTTTGSVTIRDAVLTSTTTPTSTTQVATTFAGRTYASSVTASANTNAAYLARADLPTKTQMRDLVAATARSMGVDPALAQAVAQQESGFNMRVVSPANAIGVMQVIPSSGAWASALVGRPLDLRDPQDNVVAGVAILRSLVRSAPDTPTAIAGYYQGLAGVKANGMYADTKRYVASVAALMKRFA